MSLRVIFAGTPEFSVPTLKGLFHADFEVIAVLTQPDRRAGRGRSMQTSPVKQLAQQHKLPIYQPPSLTPPDGVDWVGLEADVMVVVAYGLILPQSVLDTPRLGCINIHASCLPRWRGAAPIQRAIQAGDRETGVCIMQMDAGLDTGPVLVSQSIMISPRETAASLHDKLATIGGQLLPNTLRELAAGRLSPQPQADRGVTYAHKLEKSESIIDWTRPAGEIERSIRAFNPWPVAQTRHEDTVIRIWSATVADTGSTPRMAGVITALNEQAISVQTGDRCLMISSLQRTGGKRLGVKEFLNGYQLKPGDRFSDDPGR